MKKWRQANSPLRPFCSIRLFPEGRARRRVSFLWVAIIEKRRIDQRKCSYNVRFFLFLPDQKHVLLTLRRQERKDSSSNIILIKHGCWSEEVVTPSFYSCRSMVGGSSWGVYSCSRLQPFITSDTKRYQTSRRRYTCFEVSAKSSKQFSSQICSGTAPVRRI